MTSNNTLKVAVTGANGFVGSYLVKKFIEKGFVVKALVRPKANVDLLPDNAEIVKVDYNDLDSLTGVFDECECLIHNAAITRGKGWKDFGKHNIELTAKLVKIANNSSSLRHFIFISSQAAAGCSASPKKETDECTPLSYYGKSKLAAEKIIKDKCLINWTIARPCSVYGPGDKDFLQYFKMVKRGLSVLVGFRTKWISLIYVEHLGEYIAGMVGNRQAYQKTFFLSDGNCYTWEDFVTALEEIVGRKTRCIRVPEFIIPPLALGAEIGGIMINRPLLLNWQKSKEILACHWICDNNESKKLLKNNFEGTMKDNLLKTFKWYKENRWL